MRAYDVETGKPAWSQKVDGANASSIYGLRVHNDLVAGFRNYFVRLRDGQAIWGSSHVDNSTQTPLVAGDTIYTWFGAPGAMRAMTIPADTDGGKVTPGVTFKTEWNADDLPKTKARPFDREWIASPLYVDGLIYRICCGGGLLVNDAASGEIVYSKVLPLKPHTEYWAYGGAAISPTLAGKNIFLLDNQGRTVIIEPGRQYKEIAVNRIEEEGDNNKEQVQNLANPYFEGSRIYACTFAGILCTASASGRLAPRATRDRLIAQLACGTGQRSRPVPRTLSLRGELSRRNSSLERGPGLLRNRAIASLRLQKTLDILR